MQKPRDRTVTVRKPGQPGTKKLLAKYGDRLERVRYKYDKRARRSRLSVELLEEEKFWYPGFNRLPETAPVGLRIDYLEEDVRSKVKGAGGRWDPELRIWFLPKRHAIALGLLDRIVRLGAPSTPQNDEPQNDEPQNKRRATPSPKNRGGR